MTLKRTRRDRLAATTEPEPEPTPPAACTCQPRPVIVARFVDANLVSITARHWPRRGCRLDDTELDPDEWRAT